MGGAPKLVALVVCVSPRGEVLRIIGATAIALTLLGTVMVLNWPEPLFVKPETVVVTKTPAGCDRFARNADAFVAVTDEFLEVQNTALSAVIDQDKVALEATVTEMEHISVRYDNVMDRYADSRAGCL